MQRIILFCLIGILFMIGCNDASVTSSNISRAADQFEVYRRVVFYNGITDKYILSVEGYSSIYVDQLDKQLELTVKTGPRQFVKHYLGLSDNVTYFAEQLLPAAVSDARYRVIFKPSVIVPNIDLE